MAGNTFGKAFRLTTFGESHGVAIGGIIDGCPAGIDIDLDHVQSMLDKRRPGLSAIVSQRKEDDRVEFLSGIFEGKTLGTPIGFIIKNKDVKASDYDHLKSTYRPSHADYTWEAKYGIRDHRGGGRASARETACRVVGGAIAEELLKSYNISINSWVSSVGELTIPDNQILDMGAIYSNDVRCPHTETANKMIELIKEVRSQGDSLGGIITCSITGVPAGLGEPVFDKLHADLGKAMLSINAVKGFEIGSGFEGSKWRGSRHNDPFSVDKGKIKTISNFSGGIQGGISNGEEIIFRTAFKPTATIIQSQETVTSSGEAVTLEGKGRHDPCVVPRAVPIVQSMAALVIADHLLRNRSSKL